MEALMSITNKRPPRKTNEEVVEAFMNQRVSSAGALTTDGQSLYSYNLRIAEHLPNDDGASTIVYDYTSRGGAYKSQTTSSHVGLVKQRVPRRNVMLVEVAEHAGLIR
tara:strand:+ start:554 stop:877 length:324 start_codon:yes stop_codon:yes gene_type:complete